MDARAGHPGGHRHLVRPAQEDAAPAGRATRRQPDRRVDRRAGLPHRLASVQQRPAPGAHHRVRHRAHLDPGGTCHRHPPPLARRAGDRGSPAGRDGGPPGPHRAGTAAGRRPRHRPRRRRAPPAVRAIHPYRGPGGLGRGCARLHLPGPDPGHRRRIRAHQICGRSDDRLVPGIPALLLPDRRIQCRRLTDPAYRGVHPAALPLRHPCGTAAPRRTTGPGQRTGVAPHRQHRHRIAATDLHPHQVGHPVRHFRGVVGRARSGRGIHLCASRSAFAAQFGAVRDGPAVHPGLVDLGHQRLVLRRQLRRAVVRQATAPVRPPRHHDLPCPVHHHRADRRLAALPSGLCRAHRGREHPAQSLAGLDPTDDRRRHHGDSRSDLDGQGCCRPR
ncbi:Uncharacterised protein [Mycobacteroides abscessus subsp. bolletii]|nr:Uncharacterised protein [Mycobacteroides abscessus subsp. bolletii]